MKHSLRDGSGYLEIDHTNSPGIQESDIPIPLRPTAIAVPSGKKFEADIQFCAHCGSQVILNPNRVRPRSYCARCNHYICDNPICNSDCIPFKKVLDKAEKSIARGKEPLIKLTDA